MSRRLLAFVVPFALAACATTPAPLTQGPFSGLTPTDALASSSAGLRVRWGGMIVSVRPQKDETCFEILSRPLDGQARPRQTDETTGRFLACANGFYDPAAYPAGRELTVVGTVQPPVTIKIGDYDYRAPRIEVQALHLWPEREVRPAYYYDPFWGYPWPYRYPYRHPFFW